MTATIHHLPAPRTDDTLSGREADITWAASLLLREHITPADLYLDPPLCSELEARMADLGVAAVLKASQ